MKLGDNPEVMKKIEEALMNYEIPINNEIDLSVMTPLKNIIGETYVKEIINNILSEIELPYEVIDEEKLPELLHILYLEATKKLKPESYNPNAQKEYKDLTEEQKFIDKYIAHAIAERFVSKKEVKRENMPMICPNCGSTVVTSKGE
jgi:hypothetical protein